MLCLEVLCEAQLDSTFGQSAQTRKEYLQLAHSLTQKSIGALKTIMVLIVITANGKAYHTRLEPVPGVIRAEMRVIHGRELHRY